MMMMMMMIFKSFVTILVHSRGLFIFHFLQSSFF